MGINPKHEKFLADIQSEVLEFFELNDYRSYSINQIHKAFAIRDRKQKKYMPTSSINSRWPTACSVYPMAITALTANPFKSKGASIT